MGGGSNASLYHSWLNTYGFIYVGQPGNWEGMNERGTWHVNQRCVHVHCVITAQSLLPRCSARQASSVNSRSANGQPTVRA